MDIEGWNGSSPGSDELAAEYDVVVAGTMAGAHINADLIAEETERAVAARRGRQPGAGVPR
jgi:hypothetical protein